MFRKLVPLLISAAVATGCYGTTTVGYSPGYAYATPDLAYVSPGVSVIANYEQPIFYSGGYYYTNYDGGWYRSPYYTRGWGYVGAPPYAISTIRNPYAYRYYRPYGYAPRYRPVPYNQVERPYYQGYRGGTYYRGGGTYYRGGTYNRGGTYYRGNTYNRGGTYYRGGSTYQSRNDYYRGGGSTYRGGTYRGGTYRGGTYRGGTYQGGGTYRGGARR